MVLRLPEGWRKAAAALLAPPLPLIYYTCVATLLLCGLWFCPAPPGENSLFYQTVTHFFYLPLLSVCTGFLGGRWVRRAWFVPLIPPGVESLAMLLNRPAIALRSPGVYFLPFLLYLALGAASMGLSLLLWRRTGPFPRAAALLAAPLCLLIFYPLSHLLPSAAEPTLWLLFFPALGAGLGLWAGARWQAVLRWRNLWFAPLLAYLLPRLCWPPPSGLVFPAQDLALLCGGICGAAMPFAKLAGKFWARYGKNFFIRWMAGWRK